MKKKVIIFSTLLIAILFIIYFYPINLKNKLSSYEFDKLEIHEVFSHSSYSIDNKQKIYDIYDHVTNRKVRRIAKWFHSGFSAKDGKSYELIFSSSKHDALIINLIGSDYIIIDQNQQYYKLNNGFDLSHFETMIK